MTCASRAWIDPPEPYCGMNFYCVRWLVTLLSPGCYLLAGLLKRCSGYEADLAVLAVGGAALAVRDWPQGPWWIAPAGGSSSRPPCCWLASTMARSAPRGSGPERDLPGPQAVPDTPTRQEDVDIKMISC